MMGNKGGRIHDPETQTLLNRKWASKRWIICVTEFKERQRQVMGHGYTELFFMDETSALAAGHRPCFECRRAAANQFAEIWQECLGVISGSVADGIDKTLHQQRTSPLSNLYDHELKNLPDGTMVRSGKDCFALKNGQFHEWSGTGYKKKKTVLKNAELLTPRSILAVLENGYQPVWHPTIN